MEVRFSQSPPSPRAVGLVASVPSVLNARFSLDVKESAAAEPVGGQAPDGAPADGWLAAGTDPLGAILLTTPEATSVRAGQGPHRGEAMVEEPIAAEGGSPDWGGPNKGLAPIDGKGGAVAKAPAAPGAESLGTPAPGARGAVNDVRGDSEKALRADAGPAEGAGAEAPGHSRSDPDARPDAEAREGARRELASSTPSVRPPAGENMQPRAEEPAPAAANPPAADGSCAEVAEAGTALPMDEGRLRQSRRIADASVQMDPMEPGAGRDGAVPVAAARSGASAGALSGAVAAAQAGAPAQMTAPHQALSEGSAEATPADDWTGVAGGDSRASGAPLRADAPPPHAAPSLAARVVQQLAEAAARQGPSGAIELRLDPAELGEVRITLTQDGGTVGALVVVERAETLDLMRRHAGLLAAALGTANGEVTMSLGGFAGGQGRGSASRGGGAAAGETPAAAAGTPAMAGKGTSLRTGAASLDLRL